MLGLFTLLLSLWVLPPTPVSDIEPLPQEGERKGGVVKLTRPDGTPIWVNPRTVAFIRGPLPGEQGNTTIVFSSGAKQNVAESVNEIGKIMEVERR